MRHYTLNPKLTACLDEYSDTRKDTGTSLQKAFDNAADSEKIVPVLGMQGMGKSTLINGLLQENILPNDVDETTCVPVEVKYGEKECAIVHFKDGSQTIEVNTREELNEYVDNNYNPANEKHVARIELFRKNALLQGGLVIVDLPGVGSMTHVNEETTNHYVENLCSAIFVIPTVPTIRNKEAMFIKALWSQFSTAIFVQNDWGETADEIKESMDFNCKVLRRIAEELHNPFDGKILLVNAYNAIAGAVKGDMEMVKSSNIKSLYDKIVGLSDHWEEEKYGILNQRLYYSIIAAMLVVERRIGDIDKSRDAIKKEQQQRLYDFDKTTRDIKGKIQDLREDFESICKKISTLAKDEAEKSCSKMRAGMHHIIDGGVYDGEHLNKAFEDYSDDTSKEYFDALTTPLHNLKVFLDDGLNDIAGMEFGEEIGEGNKIKGVHLNSQGKIKYEKGIQIGMNLGGAAGGAVAAAPVAMLLASNPAGWLVAGVGFAIWGAFSLGGYAVKKGVQSSRAKDAKKLVDPKIKQIKDQLTDRISSNINDTKEKVDAMLRKIERNRDIERENLIASFSLASSDDNKPRLEADLKFLNTEKEKLENGKQ